MKVTNKINTICLISGCPWQTKNFHFPPPQYGKLHLMSCNFLFRSSVCVKWFQGQNNTAVTALWHVVCNQKNQQSQKLSAVSTFCFSSFVLLTSLQLVQLKTLFHHMLSRSSSAAENAAKNLSAGFTVRMSCFTSTSYLIQLTETKKTRGRKGSPWTLLNWLFPKNRGQVQSRRAVTFSGFTEFSAPPPFLFLCSK